ncbi:MAG: tetratricopeptide repeat protein, partial [Verrucomicrobiales bacterium]
AINAAARRQAEAFDDLTTFIRLHPTHRFTADAEMALAELHLNQVPPRAVASREHLAAAASHSLTPAQKERSDYISIWLEVAAEDRATAARLAVDFLKNWTASAHAADLTLLLGELSFVSAKYGDAFHWFSRHAVEFPLSPQAEAAEYFAALSAQRFPDGAGDQQAQALWTTLVGRRGPYAAEAQHELGLLHMKKEQFEAAIAAFDAVLALSPSPDLKSATLCDRGQALFARANLNAPGEEDWNRAIKSFSEVESDVSTPRSWRLQAAVRRGRCLERLGRPAEAITAYQTAMALPEGGLPGRTILIPVDEADWFYRAGFDAIRLLDLQKRHQEAVDIAEALAASNGPRSLEAGELATQIRLRHFLWETAPP